MLRSEYGVFLCELVLGSLLGGMVGFARESLMEGSIRNELRLWV